MNPVTFDDLQALDLFEHATVFGTRPGQYRITAVDVVEPPDVLTATLTAGSAVVLPLATGPARHRQHLLDILLRRGDQARVGAIVVIGFTGEVPAATRILADRFAIPVLLAPDGLSALEVSVRLRSTVLAPELAMSTTLLTLSRQLTGETRSLHDVTQLVSKALNATVGVSTAQGAFIAGVAAETPTARLVGASVPEAFPVDSRSVAVVPVRGLAGYPRCGRSPSVPAAVHCGGRPPCTR
ncbi:hypothetical protein [Amycolatopsis jejuensis]|uniref:hypothetical protein n=1 Tax=Amycolatopsis jejuensis TaxID=330084 RepID=UPI0005271A0B|nr:hypothetical protein [Amycolatopsis jejuensis]